MSEYDDHIYGDAGENYACWCGEVHGPGSSGVERRAEDAEVAGSIPAPATVPSCAKCGREILADTEDWPEPLCIDHWDAQRAHDELMTAAKKAAAGISNGENGRKRKASVERYMYQFMGGHGTTVSRAFKDGWDRTFGKKQAAIDVGKGMTATGDASNVIRSRGKPKSYVRRPPRACTHPTEADIERLLGLVVNSTLSLKDMMGIVMRGLGGKANPYIVRKHIIAVVKRHAGIKPDDFDGGAKR